MFVYIFIYLFIYLFIFWGVNLGKSNAMKVRCLKCACEKLRQFFPGCLTLTRLLLIVATLVVIVDSLRAISWCFLGIITHITCWIHVDERKKSNCVSLYLKKKRGRGISGHVSTANPLMNLRYERYNNHVYVTMSTASYDLYKVKIQKTNFQVKICQKWSTFIFVFWPLTPYFQLLLIYNDPFHIVK